MDFLPLTKLLLSSLSARACRYMYLNIPNYEDCIVLSNCSQDLISEYKPEFCSIYLISIPEEYLKELKVFLSVGDKDDEILVFKSFFITNILSHYKLGEVKFVYDNKTGFIQCKNTSNDELIAVKAGKKEKEEDEDDEDKEDEDNDSKMDTDIYKLGPLDLETVAGLIMNIPYVVECLHEMLDSIVTTIENITDDNIPSEELTYIEEPKIDYTHANWYKRFIEKGFNTQKIEEVNGKSRFMLLVDGLDNPSIKEFVRKLFGKKPLFKNVIFKQFVYPEGDGILKSIALTEVDDIEIITSRPYSKTILINK